MRSIAKLLLSVLIAIPFMSFTPSKTFSKKQKAQAKEKERELRADGWKLYGKADTLLNALLFHYVKLESMGEGSHEVFGIASQTNSAQTDDLFSQIELQAKSVYVKQRRSYVVSKAVTELGLSAGGRDEFEHFYSASRLNAEGVVRNELKKSYALFRKTADGLTEIMVFYIVNPGEVAESNIQAFRDRRKGSRP